MAKGPIPPCHFQRRSSPALSPGQVAAVAVDSQSRPPAVISSLVSTRGGGVTRGSRVPLSSRAVAVLDKAREIADKSGLVFPSPTGRLLSDSTLSKLLRDLGIGVVPHGFRSSFRDWSAERTDLGRRAASPPAGRHGTSR